MPEWPYNPGIDPPFDAATLQPFDSGRRVYGGFDLSSTTDLTSFAMVQRRDDGGWNVNWLTWLPEDNVDRATKRDGVPYRQWYDDGFLETPAGSRILHNAVINHAMRAAVEHDIGVIGFDPWNAEWVISRLEQEGIQAVKVSQGYASLSEPSKHLEASVADGTFKHGGNPIARWCAENIEVQTDVNGNIRPVKPVHGSTKRIDLLVAAIIAMAVAIVDDGDMLGSTYAEPGNLSL